MAELIGNRVLWTVFIATVAAQVFKLLLVYWTEKRWMPERLLETGGMPSSHSAAVASLATSLGSLYGWGSAPFSVSVVFGLIIMYDATGIRRAAGIQAELLNDLVNELAHLFDDGFRPQALKTLLGHTYPQVLVGALLGVSVGFLLSP